MTTKASRKSAPRKSGGRPSDPLRKDFRNFLYAAWKQLGLPEPTKVQYEIAWYLQHGENPRKVIEAFRGVGKSWITSVFALWRRS